jgi:MFS superfamily sulfate permease-like transporter
MGIVLLTETSVVLSALEIAVTVGAQFSVVAIVDSSSSLVEEQEKARARTDSKLANAMEKLLNFRSSKTPFS